MSNIPQVLKKLTKTPVVEGVKPLAKSMAVASDISDLPEYLTITGYRSNYVNPYVRQLLFQYNFTLPYDFYVLNVDSYQSLANLVITGGCLCIKYRVGAVVYRYIILDHKSDNWSNFIRYSNQRIKKNFCVEFWADNLLSYETFRGIIQGLIFRISNIIIPDNVEQDATYNDIPNPPLTVDDLGIVLPENLPYNQDDIVWLDNVQDANDLIELTNVNLRVLPDINTTYRLQLNINGEWITVGTDGVPPQVDLTGTNLRFKTNKGPQWYDSDTGKWHTLTVENNPPQIFIDTNGED